MRKLLYITVNSKPEELSASKTVGRRFVNSFIEKNPDFKVEELDLYKVNLPRLEYKYFKGRNCAVGGEDKDKLNDKDKKEVDQIVKLAQQFASADAYVIAVPMWSLSFPSPLKEYVDCIMQHGITIEISPEHMGGLLGDKKRSAVYIQSSGAKMTWLTHSMDKGIDYIQNIFKFMGIKYFEELAVDGTGFTQEETDKAIEKATGEIDDVIKGMRL